MVHMRLLYVCTGNSYRSPLAEALTRKYRSEFEVESAGIQAVGKVSDATEKQLVQKGALKFVKPRPDQISQRALDEADEIICMMPVHSEYIKRNFEVDSQKIEVWYVKDPVHPGEKPANAFEEIEEKVGELQ